MERDIQYDSENGKVFNITTEGINYLIGSAGKSERINCSKDNVVVDGAAAEYGQDYINNCKQVIVYGNTQVRSEKDGDHKFYVIPSISHSSIDIGGKGVIGFSATDLLSDCSNITYTPNNILSLKIPLNADGGEFTLDVLNYLDGKGVSRFWLIDKHDSVIIPLIDPNKKGNETLQIDLFILSVDITMSREEARRILEKTLEEIWEEKKMMLEQMEQEFDFVAKAVHNFTKSESKMHFMS